MRGLEEYFAADVRPLGWSYYVGEEDPSLLTISIDDPDQGPLPTAEEVALNAEAWDRATRAAEQMTTAEAHIEALVHGEDWQLRWTAANRLRIRDLEDPRTVPALLDALQTDQEPQAREGIAGALGQIEGDERVVEGLRKALAFDESGLVRWTAADSLIKQGQPYP